MKITVDYWHWDDSGESPKIVDFRTTIITEQDILDLVRERMEAGELAFPIRLDPNKLRFECNIDKVET